MPTPNRYREVNFIGSRLLQARELNLLQEISQGYDSTNLVQTSYDLTAIYKQGGFLNAKANLTGNTIVTFAALDNTKPVYLFVRDRFEVISGGELGPLTLPAGNGTIYLNWELHRITSADDPSLVDISTSEDTAEMGELRITFSTTDLSGIAVAGNQLSKNTSPVIVATYTGSGGSLVVTIPDPVQSPALGGVGRSGLVALTGTTPGGIAAGNDDPRLSDARTPLADSVVDASVRTPVAVGPTNADGTPQVLIGADPGGVSAAKIVLITATQTLEAGWNWLKAQVAALLGRYNAHEGASLGVGTTHPFPTATQVGATPSSHVGQNLGLPTSHPPVVNQDIGGFRVNRNAAVLPATNDPAYAVFEGSTVKASITHDGNLTSALAALSSIPSADGDGALTYHGPLDSMAIIARVIAEHIGKVSHKNPHGLTLADLGGGNDRPYIDAQDAATLASAESYADARMPVVTLRTEAVSGGSYVILRFAPNGSNVSQHAIEIAVGSGYGFEGSAVGLPSGFGAFLGQASVRQENSNDHPVHNTSCYLSGQTIVCNFSDHDGNRWSGYANWMGVAWRVGA